MYRYWKAWKAEPAKIPGTMANFNLTFVFGMKIYSAVNIPHVRTNGVSLTRNLMTGANKKNSSIVLRKVDMKMEIPLESMMSSGNNSIMEK